MSADGSTIVSASNDQTLKVWDGRTGERLSSLQIDDRYTAAAAQLMAIIAAAGPRGLYFLSLVR